MVWLLWLYFFLLCISTCYGATACDLRAGDNNLTGVSCYVPPGVHIYTSLNISRSNVTFLFYASNNKTILTVAGQVIIDKDSILDATGQGYSWAEGGGPGAGLNVPPYSGGGYGGSGGGSGDPAKFRGYGALYNSGEAGSAGGNGGPGGGYVDITVIGSTMTVEGKILANGADCSSTQCGGGSGGTISLNAKTCVGSGKIQANGGSSLAADGYGGGGGRIYMKCDNTADFFANITAYGGMGKYPGGAGTVYTTYSNLNTLKVDNGNINSSTFVNSVSDNAGSVTWLSGNASEVDLLRIKGNSHLVITSDDYLTETPDSISFGVIEADPTSVIHVIKANLTLPANSSTLIFPCSLNLHPEGSIIFSSSFRPGPMAVVTLNGDSQNLDNMYLEGGTQLFGHFTRPLDLLFVDNSSTAYISPFDGYTSISEAHVSYLSDLYVTGSGVVNISTITTDSIGALHVTNNSTVILTNFTGYYEGALLYVEKSATLQVPPDFPNTAITLLTNGTITWGNVTHGRFQFLSSTAYVPHLLVDGMFVINDSIVVVGYFEGNGYFVLSVNANFVATSQSTYPPVDLVSSTSSTMTFAPNLTLSPGAKLEIDGVLAGTRAIQVSNGSLLVLNGNGRTPNLFPGNYWLLDVRIANGGFVDSYSSATILGNVCVEPGGNISASITYNGSCSAILPPITSSSGPQNVKTNASERYALVTWDPPLFLESDLVTYVLGYSTTNSSWNPACQNVTVRACNVTNLSPGTFYFLQIYANSSYGGTDAVIVNMSTTISNLHPPSVSAAPSYVQPNKTSALINVSYPLDDGGMPILNFTLQFSSDRSFFEQNYTITPPNTSQLFSNLNGSTTYFFRSSSINSLGESPFSEIANLTTFYCGDGVCDSGFEVCDSCFFDCGSCENGTKACLGAVECSGRGQCMQGICNCTNGWNGANCESNGTIPVSVSMNVSIPIVNISIPISPDLPNVPTDITFSIVFEYMQEVNMNENILHKEDLQNTNLQHFFNYVKNDTTATNDFTLTLSNGAMAQIIVYQFFKPRTVMFANQTILLAENSIKYSISVTRWPFRALQNLLQIGIQTTVISISGSDCVSSTSTTVDSSGNLLTFNLELEGVELYGKFQESAEIDSSIRRVKFFYDEISKYTIVTVPSFFYSAAVDPNFAVLIDPFKSPLQQGCTSKTKPHKSNIAGKVAGAVIGGVVGLAICVIWDLLHD